MKTTEVRELSFFYRPAACMCKLLHCCVQFRSLLSENNF